MTFLRTCLREKPSALYMMDDTTPFQDHSSYNRVGISVGTAPTTAPALVRGAQFSQVFKSGSTAKFESPLFRQGYEKQNFTLEAAVRTINVAGVNTAQTYRENAAYNPVGVSSGQPNVAWEYNSRWSWVGSFVTGAVDSPIGRTTYNRQTSPASIQTSASTRGIDLYINPDLTIATTSAANNAQAVTAGEVITISAWVRYSSSTPVILSYRIHDGAGNWLMAASNGSTTSATAGQWIRVSRTITADFTGYIGLSLRSAGTQDWPASSTMDITGLMIERSPATASYFDGSMPGNEWSGTANASKSRTRRDIARVNLATHGNGAAAMPTTGNPLGFADTYWHGTYSIQSNSGLGTGLPSTYIRKTLNQAVPSINNGDPRIAFTRANPDNAGTGTSGLNGYPVIGGATYTVSFYTRTSKAGNDHGVMWRTYDAVGANLTSASPTVLTNVPANTWVRVSLVLTMPTNATWIALATHVAAGSGGQPVLNDTYDVTALLFEQVGTVRTYFDGSTAGSAWSGTAGSTWSYVLTSSTPQQVLSNLNQYDGLTINGTVVSFGTKHLTTPDAIVSYDLQQPRAAILHGVHTQDKNSLYVDGVLAAEISLTAAQQADQFIVTDNYLYSGTTTSSQAIALNGIGVYPFALPADAILRHAQAARAVPRGSEIVPGKGGDYIPLSLSNSDLFLDQWWSTALDWTTAQLQNVAVKQDQLVPQFDNITGLSLPGAWYDTFGMDNSGATALYGVALNWDGVGATVEVSLDGTTWETAQRGRMVALIPPGFNPTNKELQLCVSFPGGIAGDTSYIDNLNVIGLKSGTPPTVAGRTITLTGAHQERDHFPLEMHDNWGIEVDAGGTVVIGADTSGEASVIRTLELWIKPTTATNPTVSFSGTYYQNGAASTVTLPTGQWTLFHIVGSADQAGAVTITGPAQIGQAGIYSTALSASEVASIYATYVGTNIFTAGDSSTIVIAESTPAAKIYASDWAIAASG